MNVQVEDPPAETPQAEYDAASASEVQAASMGGGDSDGSSTGADGGPPLVDMAHIDKMVRHVLKMQTVVV